LKLSKSSFVGREFNKLFGCKHQNCDMHSTSPLQRDGYPVVGHWAEMDVMPCPERDMKVTGFDAKWVEATNAAGLNLVEHYTWILQSYDYVRRRFIGRIGRKCIILQKNKKGEEFGVRLGVWRPHLRKWEAEFSNRGVRETPFDGQAIGYDGIWRGERDWRKSELVDDIEQTAVIPRQYYIRAHEFIESEEAGHLF
jgi:hypothetical protein